MLEKRAYDVNNVADLERAAANADAAIRRCALLLLGQKFPKDVVPVFKKALDDPWPTVRRDAARLLGVLGDTSGLETMRRDILKLTAEDALAEEPKEHRKGAILPLLIPTKEARLGFALDAAQVLAEFGDSTGYAIAARATLDDKSAGRRITGIRVLAELARLDKATLRMRGCDPEAVLLVAADAETDGHALRSLYTAVSSRMRPEPAMRILDKVQRSPHLSEKRRGYVRTMMKRIEKRRLQEERKQEGKPDQ